MYICLCQEFIEAIYKCLQLPLHLHVCTHIRNFLQLFSHYILLQPTGFFYIILNEFASFEHVLWINEL